MWSDCPYCHYPKLDSTACENPGCWANLPPAHRERYLKEQEERIERERVARILYNSTNWNDWSHED